MSVRMPINGNTLKWARDVLDMDQETLGKAANLKPERIGEFEAGTAQPTLNQAKALAKRLDRSVAFLLAPPPQASDVPKTVDFRGHDGKDYPAALAKEIKRAEQQRDALRDFEDLSSRVKLGKITWDNLDLRASEFRNHLGLTPGFVPPVRDADQAFNFWRGALENAGYLVFQTTGIERSVFKGLSLEHEVLPIILVNGSDFATSKVFTLFHEVAHIANRTSGLCLLHEEVWQEALSNRFAATFLMPTEEVKRALASRQSTLSPMEQIAARFRVSKLAAAIRLRHLDIITEADLEEIRQTSDDAWQQRRQKQRESDGFVPPWRLRYRDLGSTYIGAVARAVDDRRIDLVDATYLLNARLPMVEKIFEEYFKTGGAQ
ncbi:helix-turn-helix domain-containing protein [Propionibacterium freudenreichii]|uniref:helix-turn-helix domain-containing protein n=1 Tax=Propionibacterium freudenreichii TaxID=1744 RepID=UPI0021A8D7E0|nr:XRE family transcriptional regulator [Propionibacterium freudenreichii]MCT2997401.1 ImmA/IrrE family metallo-endopeptidase [Propionibacterium freudenreichii]